MTRKDYESIARALATYREDIRREHAHTRHASIMLDTVDDVVEILADIFTVDNPRFTPDRFRQATR